MTEARRRDPVAPVRFIASAGTGKTHQVTSLYSALILGRPYPAEKLGPLAAGAVFDGYSRVPCEEILMLTFARNAASEMRARITAEIERQLDRDPDRADFYWSLLRRISGAVISTIHSFGQRLIAQNALDLGIAPDFTVLEDEEAARLLNGALAGRLRRTLAAGNPAIEELCLGRKSAQLVAGAAEFLGRCESRGLDLAIVDPEELAARPEPPPPSALADLADFCRSAGGNPNAVAGRFLEALEERLSVRDPEEIAAAAGELLSALGGSWGKGMKEIREEVKSRLASLAAYPDRVRARGLLAAFLGYAGDALRDYRAEKRSLGVIDFGDLLLRAGDLVREKPGVLPELSVIIIDEAQDNSRAQNELIGAIRKETGAALILCGDEKQTIHTWRGADPEGMVRLAGEAGLLPVPLQVSYRSKKPILDWVNEIFRETVLGEERYGPEAELRSCPWAPASGDLAVELLLPEWEAVPGSVEVPGKKETAEKAGLELTGKDLEGIVAGGEYAGGVPRERWEGWLARYPKRHSDEARAVAERISLLCRPGAPPSFRPREIYDPETRWENDRTRYRYRDVTILLRAATRQELYEAALRERSIPYTGVGKGRGFYFRQEVRDVASLLAALAFPRDDLARLAVLRSPFFSLSDRALGKLLAGGDGGERFRMIFTGDPETAAGVPGLEGELEDILRASRVLGTLRRLAGRWNGTDLIRRAIDLTGYDAVLAGSFNGLQRLANLRLLLSQLADRERKDRLDLAGLARYLAGEIERETQAPDAAVLDPSNDAVVISTIHAAKGLSSPVVFLPDLRRTPRADSSWLRVAGGEEGLPGAAGKLRVIGEGEDRLDLETADWEGAKAAGRSGEEVEEKRLFYVAATRARDLVVLSGENAGRKGAWRDWINRYLLDPPRGWEKVRPIPYPELAAACPAPGEGGDSAALPLAGRLAFRPEAPPIRPLPESHRLAATVLAGVPERERGEGEEEWRRRLLEFARTGLINLPPIYLMSRSAEGEGEREPAGEGGEGEDEKVSAAGMRVEAGIYGHAVLEKLDFSRPVAGQVREAAAGYGAGEAERTALERRLEKAAAAVARMLEGADPEKVIREMPFSARFEDDGAAVIVDGTIDLLFFREGEWRIVDYKFSGRPAGELKKKYGLQLAIYREAVSRAIPGRNEREPLFPEGTSPAPFRMTVLGIGPDGEVREVEIGEEEAGDVPARAVAAARLIRSQASPGKTPTGLSGG